MTFEEARKKLLTKLDETYSELVTIVADRTWTNLNYNKYKETTANLVRTIESLARLNECEMEANKGS